MTIQRVAITGSSGAYARGVIRELRSRSPEVTILGLDLVEASEDAPDQFLKCDVLSDSLLSTLQEFAPDTVIHFAFVLNPTRDDARMHEINVGGTKNLLAAAAEVQPARLMISSSATAYGAWPDNPVPMDEDWPLRARKEFRYAHDKWTIEGLLKEFAEQHKGIAVSWTRPCLIYGPGTKNYMTSFIIHGPVIPLPGGNNTELQFVHTEDVSRATALILERNGRGPYNVAPSDWVTMKELARMTKRLCFPAPFFTLKAFTFCWWGLRLPVFHFPPSFWYFSRYPWVITPKRLTEELGFEFEHSSKETLKLLLADAGKLRRDE